jgi:hypothetical protein
MHQKHLNQIVITLIYEMGLANDVVYYPTDGQTRYLSIAVRKMYLDGCTFSRADIDELTDGDEDDMKDKYSKYNGFEDLNKALIDIFENAEQEGGSY